MNKYFQSTGYGSNTADSGLIVEFDGYTKGVVVRADNAGIYEVGHSSLTWVPHTLAEYWTEVEWPVEEEFAMNNKTQLQLLLEVTVAPLEDRMKAVYVDKDGQIEYWFNGDIIDNPSVVIITPAIRHIVDTYLEGGWEINYGEAPNYELVDALFADYMVATRVPPPTHNWDITSNACVIIYREHKPDIKTNSQEDEKKSELEKECELLRMQLAACGMIALSNTESSLKTQTENMLPEYLCSSVQDVINAVKREIRISSELKALEKERLKSYDDLTLEDVAEIAHKHGVDIKLKFKGIEK